MRIARAGIYVVISALVVWSNVTGAQQPRKWVEPDGRVIYSDVQPSRTARLAGSVKSDSQPAGSAERIEAGRVEFLDGQVSISGAGTANRRAVVGTTLFEGDVVVTGEKGELHAEMADGAVIAVRPNSQISIVRYRAKGQSSDSSIMSLVRGGLRSITGFIAKTSPSAYEVRTPIATIGVRGTDHEVMVVPAASNDAQPGVYSKVNEGSTTLLANNGGSVAVAAGQAGFLAQGAQSRPQVLANVPSVFRPPANDSRMQGRHQQVQAGLTEKRGQAQSGQGMQRTSPGNGPGQTPGAGKAGAPAAPAKGQGAPAQSGQGQPGQGQPGQGQPAQGQPGQGQAGSGQPTPGNPGGQVQGPGSVSAPQGGANPGAPGPGGGGRR